MENKNSELKDAYLLKGLKQNMLKEDYHSVGIALNCSILAKRFPVGSQVGFKVKRKHYKIIRDE